MQPVVQEDTLAPILVPVVWDLVCIDLDLV